MSPVKRSARAGNPSRSANPSRECKGLKIHIKLLITGLLLSLAVFLVCFSATNTIQAYKHVQQNNRRVQSGDVSTVSSWMTIPYISRVYHVPELCFTQTLNISNRTLAEHATLRTLADHYHWPLPTLIQRVQQVILQYHQKLLSCDPPPKNSPTTGTGGHAPPAITREGVKS